MNTRRAAFFLGLVLAVTSVTPAAAQPSRLLPTPTLQSRGEYGLIMIAPTRFMPDTDPALTATLGAAQIQERLRAELRRQVAPLKGYSFAADNATAAPTILEVRIERVVLAKDSLVDGAPALVLRARARLVQPAYGRTLYDQRLEYRSPKRTMTEWRRFDFASVHQDLSSGIKALAQKAADDIFLVYDGPRP
jgi:hypothetical protein